MKLLCCPVEFLEQVTAQCLVTAGNPWVYHAGIFVDPLLTDFGAHTAAKAIEVAFGVAAGEMGPFPQALSLDVPGYQLVTQLDGRRLPPLFITGAYLGTLVIGHQW